MSKVESPQNAAVVPPQQIPQIPTPEQQIAQIRNNIVLAHQNSQQESLNSFNSILQYANGLNGQLQFKNERIKFLEGICDENKLDHKPKPVPIPPKNRTEKRKIEKKNKKI